MDTSKEGDRPDLLFGGANKKSPWWSLLTRNTSSGRLIPALDGLRCVAIMAVVMHHLGGYVEQRTPGLDAIAAKHTIAYRMTNVGNTGVQLFFLISGFIVALPFAEQILCGGTRIRLGSYFRRRMARLYPPYLVNLLALSALRFALSYESWSEGLPHLLASVCYVHNLAYQSMSTINGVAWTLEIEVQFYLLVPLLTLVYWIPSPLLRRAALLGSILAVVLSKVGMGANVGYPLTGSVLYYLDYFLGGLLLADWYATSNRAIARRLQSASRHWDLLAIAFGIACLLCPMNVRTFNLLPIVLLPAFACAIQGSAINWLLSRPLFVVVGGMSYTIYLYHFGVISAVGRCVAPYAAGYSYPAALALQSIFVLPAIVAFCAVLYALIEKPWMTGGRRSREVPANPAHVEVSHPVHESLPAATLHIQ